MIHLILTTTSMTSTLQSQGAQALLFHQEDPTPVSMETAGLSSVLEFSVALTTMEVTVPRTAWLGMTVEVTTLVELTDRRYVEAAGVSLQVTVQQV